MGGADRIDDPVQCLCRRLDGLWVLGHDEVVSPQLLPRLLLLGGARADDRDLGTGSEGGVSESSNQGSVRV